MSKRFLQDVVPGHTPEPSPRVTVRPDARVRQPRQPRQPRRTPKIVVLLGVAGIIAVVLFALTGFVSRATVFVTPRSETVPVDYSLRAAGGAGAADVHFEVVRHQVEGVESVPANGVQRVDRKAKGTLIVYNAYSSAEQPLVKNTRFESKSGKIYRIEQDVTIPGMSGGLPGSKEVVVVADEPGASYNSPLTDFTIPGFKGTPRYDKFYARSKTEIAGGFSGEVPNAAPEDLEAALKKLEDKLTAQVRREALTEIPSGFLPYEGATRVTFKDISSSGSSTSTASGSYSIRAEARLEALLFNQKELTSELASRAIKDYKNEPIEVANLHDLDVVLSDPTIPFSETSEVILRLRGPALFLWGFDEDDLRVRLAGQRNSSFRDVLKTFPMIVRADAQISPLWALSFPSDFKRIKVIRQLPEVVPPSPTAGVEEPSR